MTDLETLSAQHAAHSSDEIDAIKEAAMDIMQVRKGQRAGVKRVLDVALYLIAKKLTPDMINVVRDAPKPPPEPKNKVLASPFLSEDDHRKYKT